MKKLVLGGMFFWIAGSWATTTLSPNFLLKECSEKFLGKVVSVRQMEIPNSKKEIEKNEILFSVLKRDRGEAKESVSLIALKNGPVRFEKDAIYDIEMSDGLLCKAQRVE